MLPGQKVQLKDEDAEKGEAELRKMEAIITSMTRKEREKPSLINPSASGASLPAAAPGSRTSTGCCASTNRCRKCSSSFPIREK